MKKYTYTSLETVKTYDGDNVLFDKTVILDFAKVTLTKKSIELTEEEKAEYFQMRVDYIDVFREFWNKPLYELSGLSWALPDAIRTPSEEYELFMSLDQDQDFSDEAHILKKISLEQHHNWFQRTHNQ